MDGQTSQAQLTFAGHIRELRRRLTLPAMMLIIGGTLGYVFHVAIINFLRAPLHQTLYYSTPAGSLSFVMKVCMILGIALAIPTLIYSLVSFIEPAVNKAITRRLIAVVTILSLVLGVAGAVFAYYVVLPMSLHFFAGIKLPGVSPLISADNYLNFALMCILTFILLFQLPLIVLFINHIKPMSPRKLLKYEKYVIVGSFALALVLPFTYDPLTQFLIAVPIILLYNLSIIFVWMANRGSRKAAKAQKTAAVTSEPNIVTDPGSIGPIPDVLLADELEPAFPVNAQPIPVMATAVAPTQSLSLPVETATGERVSMSDFSAIKPEPTIEGMKHLTKRSPRRSRPFFDIGGGSLNGGNFLDLRPTK